jgi:hypothetical protein
MKNFLILLSLFVSSFLIGQDIPIGGDVFKASFTVDSVTLGVDSNQMNVSGRCWKWLW